MQGKDFAERIGITPVQLSRLENSSRRVTQRMDLLIRLAIAALIAARDGKPIPADLAPLVHKLESWDIGSHRVRHNDAAPADREWEEATA